MAEQLVQSLPEAPMRAAPSRRERIRRRFQTKTLREQLELYAILLPVLALIFIFMYLPMYGIVIAFQEWFPGKPFIDFGGGVTWVGLKHIQTFLTGPFFGRIFRNTLILGALNIGISFWIPIVFALLLNEIKNARYKKVIQTASYLPYFISSVVVAGMVLSFISSDGIVNILLKALHLEPLSLNSRPWYFPAVYTITQIWRSFGWGSILYLSSISSIDPSLYEAAALDGAGRFKKMWHITLPSIKPTIVVMFIMGIGGMLNADSDMVLLLYNPAIYESADVIGTYLYRDGLLGGRFSYGAAVGLFISVINFTLVYLSNRVARKVADYSLW